MRKIFKVISISIISIILLGVLAVTLFVNFYPSFGAGPSKEQKLQFAESENYQNGKFQNKEASPMEIKMGKLFSEYTKKDHNRNPDSNIEVNKIQPGFFQQCR